MAIVYRISAHYLFYSFKTGDDVPHVGLVNIIAGERLVPELIQQEANAANIADAIAKMLDNRDYHARIRQGLAGVRNRLGDGGASSRAAAIVMELLKSAV